MISSHLTPEPERRLWLIHESVRQAVETADWKAAALTAFCGAELAWVSFLPPSRLDLAAVLPLCAALVLGAAAFSPLKRMPRRLAYMAEADDRPAPSDCLVSVEDLSKYTHGELIARFDKYLGGGITAMAYHEDIIVQIVAHARVAALKRRFFLWLSALAFLGQLGLAVLLLRR